VRFALGLARQCDHVVGPLAELLDAKVLCVDHGAPATVPPSARHKRL